MARPRKRLKTILGVIAVGTLFATGMIVSYSEALTDPQINHVSVAVTGDAEAIVALQQEDGLEITVVADDTAAKEAVLTREVEAALVVPTDGAPVTTYVASGASRALAHAAGEIGALVGAQLDIGNEVVDLAPTSPNNPNGTLSFYLVVFLTIGASLGGSLFNRVLGPIVDASSFLERSVALAALAVALSATAVFYATSILDGVVGEHGFAFFGALFWYSLAVSGAIAGIASLGGQAAGLAVTAFFVLFGNSASGGPFGVHMQNDFFQALHWVMPQAWGLELLRDIEFFDGNGIAAPLLGISLWAVLGVASAALSMRKHARATDSATAKSRPSVDLVVIGAEPLRPSQPEGEHQLEPGSPRSDDELTMAPGPRS